MRGADAAIRALADFGVGVAFGIPGGTVLSLFDALLSHGGIRLYLCAHEQGAGHMAEGYARASGRLGVVLVTSGPGASNTVTPLANACLDSTPLLVLSGGVSQHLVGRDVFQELDFLGMTFQITKAGFSVRSPSAAYAEISRACRLAVSHRRGPVAVVLPVDVQRGEAQGPSRPLDLLEDEGSAGTPAARVDPDSFRSLVEFLRAARRPLLLVGGGAKDAGTSRSLVEFARRERLPVATTLMGKGAFPEDEDLSLGMVGMHGRACANVALSRADLVLALGVRFSDRSVGVRKRLSSGAKLVQVDLDPVELGKNLEVDLPVLGDASSLISALLEEGPIRRAEDEVDWVGEVRSLKEREESFWSSHGASDKGVSPRAVFEELNALRARGIPTTVVTEVGQCQMWAAYHYRALGPDDFITSGGLGTMGFGFPASIGAKIARPDREVVCVAGDGSFLMNLQELSTVSRYGVPVKVLLLNNRGLGMVRQHQRLFANGRTFASTYEKDHDFVAVAAAFGVKAKRIAAPFELKSSVEELLSEEGPALLEVTVSDEEMAFPMVYPGDDLSAVRMSPDATFEEIL